MSKLATLIGQVAGLSTGDLLALNAFTSELCRQRQVQATTAPRGSSGKRKKKPNSVGQRKSDHDSIPEYRAFRSANKALRAYLKENNLSFKEAISSEKTKDDSPVLAFREAQGTWFRRKNEISSVRKEEAKPQALEASPGNQGSRVVPRESLGLRRLERTGFYPEQQPYRRGEGFSSQRGGYKGAYHRNQSDFCEDSAQVQATSKTSPAPSV